MLEVHEVLVELFPKRLLGMAVGNEDRDRSDLLDDSPAFNPNLRGPPDGCISDSGPDRAADPFASHP